MPTLAAALNDESIEVRRHAVDALGISLQNSASGVPALIGALADEDEFTRRNAALALSRIGEQAEEATPALAHALNDEDRYVRGKAVHAPTAHRHAGGTGRARALPADLAVVLLHHQGQPLLGRVHFASVT